jgi:hypothetical protein
MPSLVNDLVAGSITVMMCVCKTVWRQVGCIERRSRSRWWVGEGGGGELK